MMLLSSSKAKNRLAVRLDRLEYAAPWLGVYGGIREIVPPLPNDVSSAPELRKSPSSFECFDNAATLAQGFAIPFR